MKKLLFHGSPNLIVEFNLLYQGKHGGTESFGIYLADTKDAAQRYARNEEINKGFWYTIEVDLKNELSHRNLTLTDKEIEILIENVQSKEDILSNFGNIQVDNYQDVKRNALRSLKELRSDMELVNEVARLASPSIVSEVLEQMGDYTHIVTTDPLQSEEKTYIILNPKQARIIDIFELDHSTKEVNKEDSSLNDTNQLEDEKDLVTKYKEQLDAFIVATKQKEKVAKELLVLMDPFKMKQNEYSILAAQKELDHAFRVMHVQERKLDLLKEELLKDAQVELREDNLRSNDPDFTSKQGSLNYYQEQLGTTIGFVDWYEQQNQEEFELEEVNQMEVSM